MFTKKTWTNRIAEYINRRLLTYEDSTTALVTVARSEGTVSTEGDAFNADNMNDLEDRIEEGIGKYLAIQTLTAGNTTLTFTDSSITANSIITPYTNTWGVTPTEIDTVAGTVTLTFDAQSSDITCTIKVESEVS